MKKPSLARLLGGVIFLTSSSLAQTITSEVVVTGLSSPLDLKSAPGDDRLFVAEQPGTIQIIENGALRSTPFWDGTSLVAFDNFTGLRAFVFHPDYENNGHVFIAYD